MFDKEGENSVCVCRCGRSVEYSFFVDAQIIRYVCSLSFAAKMEKTGDKTPAAKEIAAGGVGRVAQAECL